MDPLIVLIAWVLPYFTVAIFVGGVSFKAGIWLLRPMPVKWALYPAPPAGSKRLGTILTEIFTLRSHMKGSKRLWGGAILFHVGLFTSFALHAFVNIWFAPIYDPLFRSIGLTANSLQTSAFLIGSAAGILTLAVVVYPFLLNRVFVREVRDISSFSDYAALILLFLTIALGTYLRLFQIVNPTSLTTYLVSLATLTPVQPPSDPAFLLHLLLAQLYLIYFPFSKPMHFIGSLINQKITTTR
jgi:nitrate reductase gamma subunit